MARWEMSKRRPVENPYRVYVIPGVMEMRVLKSYQKDDNKQYARWLVATRSIYNYGSLIPRDAYVADVIKGSRLMTLEEAEAIWEAGNE